MLLTIAVMVNFLLAIFVYKNNPKSATNLIYTLLSIVMSFWLIANYVSLQPSNLSLLLIRFSVFLATLLNAIFFLLAKTIPSPKLGLSIKSLVGLILVTGFIMFLTVTPLVFSEVQTINGRLVPTPGPGIAVFGGFSIFINILSVIILIIRYRKNNGEEKQQIRIVMYGVLALFGAVIITVFIPVIFFQISFFVNLLPLYALTFLGMTAYAIVTYHMFDLKVIATEALTFSIWIIFGAKIFSDTNAQDRVLDSLLLFAIIVFGLLLIKSVRREVEQREKLEKLTKELESANKKLKELDHLKSQFLSFASHQIKTPLAAIKGFASLICDGSYGECPPKVNETSKKISEAANRMISLVNEFLDLRKIEEGRMDYVFEKVDGVKMVGGIVEELKLLAQAKKLDLTFEPEIESVQINADTQRLRQVFQNLIENAIKYTDTGFVKVNIKLSDGNFVFSVSDSGHGIDKDILPDLFEEFKRAGTSDTKRIEGAGLGLFIAKQIVLGHKGEIWAESDGPGKGSEFFVKIPLLFADLD